MTQKVTTTKGHRTRPSTMSKAHTAKLAIKGHEITNVKQFKQENKRI